jgi:hypothetical protein
MTKVDLTNKKILYIGPVFFQYDKYLINKLIEFKANVDMFEIYPQMYSSYFWAIDKLKLPNAETYKRNFYNKMLLKKDHDFVLVRTGFQLEVPFLKKMREMNPNAKLINFHWDSLSSSYDYTHTFKYFDKIYSFDYKDCQTHQKLTYLPLFYIDEYSQNINNVGGKKEIDLLFIGAWRNKERYNLIKLTEKLSKQANLKFYHYLYLSFFGQILSLKKGIMPHNAKTRRLSHKQILELFSNTNTIIDFPSSFQTGLTMRTFETLGASKKLITTNKNIINEPFYDPEFINEIDIHNFTLNTDFIKNTPTTSLKEKMKDYSIGSYINKLFQ